jgi:hypothetical protein
MPISSFVDTNVNGKRDDYVEPNQPVDPTKDKRNTGSGGFYAVMPNPVDGSIWGTVGVFVGRGAVIRVALAGWICLDRRTVSIVAARIGGNL